MEKLKFTKLTFYLFLATIFLFSCSDDNEPEVVTPPPTEIEEPLFDEEFKNVYYPEVFNVDGTEQLFFRWHPLQSGYAKVIVIDKAEEDYTILGEIDYPNNNIKLSDISGDKKVVYVAAVGSVNQVSIPIKVDLSEDPSSLYEADIPAITISSAATGRATFMKGGKVFVPQGVNFIGYTNNEHDTFEPDHNGLKKSYDPLIVESMLRTLKRNGYNLVRVFVIPGLRNNPNVWGMSGNPEDNTGNLSAAYMDNFVDFLTRAHKYGIYVTSCFGDNDRMTNQYWESDSKFGKTTRQDILFSENALNAKAEYITKFLEYIKAAPEGNKIINALLGITMQNEFYFDAASRPWTPIGKVEVVDPNTGGMVEMPDYNWTYTYLDGSTYKMDDTKERRLLAQNALSYYYKKMKAAVIASAPNVLVGEGTFPLGAVGKDVAEAEGLYYPVQDAPQLDSRFPMTAVEYLNTDIDFLDFHIYKWSQSGSGYAAFSKYAASSDFFSTEAELLMRNKPVIMGEYGSFLKDEGNVKDATEYTKSLRKAAEEFGFQGSALWTMDTFVLDTWVGMDNNGYMLQYLYD